MIKLSTTYFPILLPTHNSLKLLKCRFCSHCVCASGNFKISAHSTAVRTFSFGLYYLESCEDFENKHSADTRLILENPVPKIIRNSFFPAVAIRLNLREVKSALTMTCFQCSLTSLQSKRNVKTTSEYFLAFLMVACFGSS